MSLEDIYAALKNLIVYGPLVSFGGALIVFVLVSSQDPFHRLDETTTVCLTIAGCISIISGIWAYVVHRQVKAQIAIRTSYDDEKELEKLQKKKEELEEQVNKIEEQVNKKRKELDENKQIRTNDASKIEFE